MDNRQNPVTLRFFRGVDILIARGDVKNFSDFCRRGKINRPNLLGVKNGTRRLHVETAAYLCSYGISAKWLLLGLGKETGARLTTHARKKRIDNQCANL